MARSNNRETQLDRSIFGTPARFMGPRLIFIATTVVLLAFGLLMIYSASSITAQTSSIYNYDPFYFVSRQFRAALLGIVLAIILAGVDYHMWMSKVLYGIWGFTIILLLLVFSPGAGQDAYGATRWINIAGFRFQPSEFTKVTLILVAAWMASRYYEEHELAFENFGIITAALVLVPLALILFQPDKGTTAILGATLIVMAFFAGMPGRYLGIFIGVGVLAIAVFVFKDDYSIARVVTSINPWSDPQGDGYQLIQGFYAFGSGGLTGVGLGLSAQKYSYLPMAHNDFIFAIIGEELGLVGSLFVLAAFSALFISGMRIAREAQDMSGRLIATGSVVLIVIQLFVNVGGVLGLIPLTGKPVPFLSYGGSTLISCLMLAGLVISVSRHSKLPDPAREMRGSWSVVEGGGIEPKASPRIRINLGRGATERLRGDDSRSTSQSSRSLRRRS